MYLGGRVEAVAQAGVIVAGCSVRGEVDPGVVAYVVLVENIVADRGEVASVRHLEPDEQAAIRLAPLGAVSEVLAQRGEHRIALGALDVVDLLYVGVELACGISVNRV